MTINDQILEQSKQALELRLKSSSNYNLQEIKRITEINPSLIGKDKAIDKNSTEILRSLCAHSNFDKELQIEKSHRKFIGPIIFNSKKLLARLTKVILKKQLKQIENISHYQTAAVINLYKKNS